MSTHRALITGALALCALAPTLASGHQLPQERQIVVQLGPERADVLIAYKEPAGERVQVFMRRFDLNGNGKLDPAEQPAAGRLWTPVLLHGLKFEIPHTRPETQPPQVKLQLTRAGDLQIMALVSYKLPKLAAGAHRDFVLTVSDVPKLVPPDVTFQAIGGLHITHADDLTTALPAPLRLVGPKHVHGGAVRARFASPSGP